MTLMCNAFDGLKMRLNSKNISASIAIIFHQCFVKKGKMWPRPSCLGGLHGRHTRIFLTLDLLSLSPPAPPPPPSKPTYCNIIKGTFEYTAKTKCRKFETNIHRKRISGPQSQFPHSCVCERIIYSHVGSAFSAWGNMWTDPGNI
jgi:hypothetical protein